MARTMTRRIRGRRCATRASFSGFACFGPLDELDAEGVEHLLQQSLFLRREIALGLGFEHRQDVDDFLRLGEVGNLPRRALANLLTEAHQSGHRQGVDERHEVDGWDRLVRDRLGRTFGVGLPSGLAGLFRRFALTPPTIPNSKALLFVHRLTVGSTIYHTSAQQSNSVQAADQLSLGKPTGGGNCQRTSWKNPRGSTDSRNSTQRMMSKTRARLRQIPIVTNLRESVRTGSSKMTGDATRTSFSQKATSSRIGCSGNPSRLSNSSLRTNRAWSP